MADVAPLKFYGRSKRNAVVPIDTRRPEWLRVRLPGGPNYSELKDIMRGLELHTVCEEARCPNIGECWEARTATFMILGDTCTRACGFCAVKTGRPGVLDLGEPVRVAEAVERMGLKHAVITSVNRDELEDGGAAIFAGTIRQIRRRIPACGIEVLIPDFMGDEAALATVMRARPDILNHNIETVPSLYPQVRPKGRYPRSLELLARAKRMDATVFTKSGIMLGQGGCRLIMEVRRLGLVRYSAAWALQNRLAEARRAELAPDTLMLLEHPHTYTIGRSGTRDHVFLTEAELEARGITCLEVDRGGDVTYH